VRHRIRALYGPRRRVEFFARTEALGWDALGDAFDGREIRGGHRGLIRVGAPTETAGRTAPEIQPRS
jgi:hypothetical protein